MTAFQRYVREAELSLPPVDPFARRLLESVRGERDVTLQLLGMQLLVENVAHAIFRNLCESLDEPVLRGLLEYIDRDEVKHVGLARNYLPALLGHVPLRSLPRVWAKPARNRRHAERLGIDVNVQSKRQFRDMNRLVRSLGTGRERLAVGVLSDRWNDWLVDRLFPAQAAKTTRD